MKIEELLGLGFTNDGGGLYRKTYNGFVVDALSGVMPNSPIRIEIRAGGAANRVCGRVKTMEEMDALISILDRGE